jgi:uncharacterized protein (DUF2147 family)
LPLSGKGLTSELPTLAGWLAMKIGTLLAASLLAAWPAKASQVDGAWVTKDLVLNIFDCEHHVCGRIAWIRDPARRPAQCGKTIVWGLGPTGPSVWTGGSILDPDNGRTYRLSATYEADGTLHARIFQGVPLFGKTEILRRVDLKAFTERC